MLKSNKTSFQPTAPLEMLRLRAQILKIIRFFFESRDVLEVETPLLCRTTATDPQLCSFETQLINTSHHDQERFFLQTSPEFAMKRMIAAGYGSIFQICKAFRNGEISKRHNPEFTLLEWYRVGKTHLELMEEVDQLVQQVLGTQTAEYISYLELFNSYFAINPHTCSLESLRMIASNNHIDFSYEDEDRDTWLNLLLSHLIEPHLGFVRPVFVYDYPKSQAALARLRKEPAGYWVGERFELYYKGIELANGYHELGNASEQLQRFQEDNEIRKKGNLHQIPIDYPLLTALPFLPDCAGVALGVDRLVLLAANASDIAEVISFPVSEV